MGGLKKISAAGGMNDLFLGFGPTLVGYSLQGSAKFGFYELFKDLTLKLVGEETFTNNRKICWALSSASAEVL